MGPPFLRRSLKRRGARLESGVSSFFSGLESRFLAIASFNPSASDPFPANTATVARDGSLLTSPPLAEAGLISTTTSEGSGLSLTISWASRAPVVSLRTADLGDNNGDVNLFVPPLFCLFCVAARPPTLPLGKSEKICWMPREFWRRRWISSRIARSRDISCSI